METMGDVMSGMQRRAWSTLGRAALMVIYLAGVAYTAIHNYSLFSRIVPPEWASLVWVVLLVTEGAAIALPLLAHYASAPGFQQLWAWLLYAIDFLFVAANTILDAAMVRGGPLPEWLAVYGMLFPAIPVAILAGIAVWWASDPGERLRHVIEQTRTAAIEAMAMRIQRAALSDEVNEIVDSAARELARRVAEQVASAPIPAARARALPPVERGEAREEAGFSVDGREPAPKPARGADGE